MKGDIFYGLIGAALFVALWPITIPLTVYVLYKAYTYEEQDHESKY